MKTRPFRRPICRAHKPATLARTHCVNGHPWTPGNLTTDTRGLLCCMPCRKQNARAAYLRIKAANAALYA